MEQSLSDLKVLDLTHAQAGPSRAQMLGFLGADVIKVEDTRGGDAWAFGASRWCSPARPAVRTTTLMIHPRGDG